VTLITSQRSVLLATIEARALPIIFLWLRNTFYSLSDDCHHDVFVRRFGCSATIYQARGGVVVVLIVDRHCERSEAIQIIPMGAIKFEPPSWIASSRSLSSGRPLRSEPVGPSQ
jgi:hypothetical protein